MQEEQLRALVREIVGRHLVARPAAPVRADACASHASHARFVLASGADADGPCFIEPAVACSHCGDRQSHGH